MNVSSYRPPDWLSVWFDHIPKGAALDLGAGHGQLARWLAGRGFQVTALDKDPALIADMKDSRQASPIKPIQAELSEFQPEPSFYSLIVAASVLHFIHPDKLPNVAQRLIEALTPGGILMVEVFTVDDPSYFIREAQMDPIAINTFALPEEQGLIHYFAKGELRGLFSNLQLLTYREERRLDPGSDYGYRAGAALVARRLVH